MRRLLTGLGAGLLVGLLFGACSEKKPVEPVTPEGPAETAVSLFQLASEAEPDLERLFDARQYDEDRLAALYDALTALAEATEPRSSAVERMEGLGRTLVDLTATLPGGGSADYSVQMEESTDGVWRITWFQGPGVEWPPRPARRGPNLSLSTART